MEIKLPYGEKHLMIDVPDSNVLVAAKPKHCTPKEDEKTEILKVLERPVGMEKISDMTSPGKRVALIVDDWGRPKVSTHKISPVVLSELEKCGVRRTDTTVVLAKGARLTSSFRSIYNKMGKDILDDYKVVVHDCDDKKNLVFYGYSSLGTPIWINKVVADADIKIGIGVVYPTSYGGYTGGAKIIVPGIAGRWTIYYNHTLFFSSDNRVGNPEVPIRRDMEEIARRVGLTMKIDYIPDNTTLDKGLATEGQEAGVLGTGLVRVFAGDPVKEHREAVGAFNELYGVNVPRKADVLIASPGRDSCSKLDGYAVFNTVPCAAQLVKLGGSIILAHPCTEGCTNEKFIEVFRKCNSKADIGDFAWRIAAMENIPIHFWDFWQPWLVCNIRLNYDLTIVPEGMTEKECEDLGFNYAESVEDALKKALKKHGENAKVTVIPHLARFIMPVPYAP